MGILTNVVNWIWALFGVKTDRKRRKRRKMRTLTMPRNL
jgi:hypothetical protein